METDRNRRTEFRSSAPYTVGVEVEFQLLDPETLDLTHKAPEILRTLSKQPGIKKEFIQSMVEVTSGICNTPSQVASDMKQNSRMLENAANEAGCLVHAASLHPFARVSDQMLSDEERYRAILDELQIVGRRLITQGLHVHVGMPDGETAIRVFDRMRSLLPLFLALTASSPFFEGEDTGLCSYRAKLFEALPRSGMPEAMHTWEDYCSFVRLLTDAEIIETPRDIWWDVRPHPELGTVEVRICDVPSSLRYIVAVAALIQAAALYLSDTKSAFDPEHRAIINSNKWQALRHGLEGNFLDPFTGKRTPAPHAIRQLVERLAPCLGEFGAEDQAEVIHEMLNRGCSANRQRHIFMKTNDLKEIIRQERDGFWR